MTSWICSSYDRESQVRIALMFESSCSAMCGIRDCKIFAAWNSLTFSIILPPPPLVCNKTTTTTTTWTTEDAVEQQEDPSVLNQSVRNHRIDSRILSAEHDAGVSKLYSCRLRGLDSLAGCRRMSAALLESTTLGSDTDGIETFTSTDISACISTE